MRLDVGPFCLLLLPFVRNIQITTSFEWSADSCRRPQVDRRAIAGIWRLTPMPAVTIPMKEFTVYPKKPSQVLTNANHEELLLMLKEDGSFQQCPAINDEIDEEEDGGKDVSKSWSEFQAKEKLRRDKVQQLVNFVKGIWDYRDGKLILAADRLEQSKLKSYDEPRSRSTSSSIVATETSDTLLEGELVATFQTKLQESHVVKSRSDIEPSQISTQESGDANSKVSGTSGSTGKSNDSTNASLDAHLSVPRGSIKIGKFFYPKTHPSFFEQPMFKPIKQGTFALRQVLGSLNTAQEQMEQKDLEKFQRSDFYNKTFLLTTQPIGRRKPQGEKRWSIKYNAFVYDAPTSKKSKNAAAEDESPVRNIRVMQIKFFANNTFASTGGLGRDVILRGRYDVIGEVKDHLWFQVIRFGFGRSVSGSVYSEGRMLSQDDAKAYWGKISRLEKNNPAGNSDEDSISIQADTSNNNLEVQGSVMDGWGLEPIPVARFIMRECMDIDDLELEDDDEDEDDDDSDTIRDIQLEEALEIPDKLDDDGIDWSNDKEGDMFQ